MYVRQHGMDKEKRSKTKPLRAPDRRFSTCTHSGIKQSMKTVNEQTAPIRILSLHFLHQLSIGDPCFSTKLWRWIWFKPQFDTLNMKFARKLIKRQFYTRKFSPKWPIRPTPKTLGKTLGRQNLVAFQWTIPVIFFKLEIPGLIALCSYTKTIARRRRGWEEGDECLAYTLRGMGECVRKYCSCACNQDGTAAAPDVDDDDEGGGCCTIAIAAKRSTISLAGNTDKLTHRKKPPCRFWPVGFFDRSVRFHCWRLMYLL